MIQKTFFDHQYQDAKAEVLPKGCLLYHGFQGEEPILNDKQALWVSTREVEALEYSRFGNRVEKGGVLKLVLNADLPVIVGSPNGYHYLEEIHSADHRLFASHLHDWACQSGIRLVRENQECYIAFRAKTDFDVLCADKWSNLGTK